MNSARVRLPGHPDAICDLVAEAIVDEYTKRDVSTRIRLSVMGGRGALFVSGDVMSKADFDVAQLITRTLGSLGVITPLEPFVSLEPVVAERATLFGSGIEAPVTVTGYATAERTERIPAPLVAARRIAQELESRRASDERWFWLGGDGEVFVVSEDTDALTASIRVEHGSKPLSEVRAEIADLVQEVDAGIGVKVNEIGADDARGIGNAMGTIGRDSSPYGDALPAGPSGIGLDILRPEKAGAWLARAAARRLVTDGARAVLVRAIYRPGERLPSLLRARDERGRDLSQAIPVESMSLDRVVQEWWRTGLNMDAARWGYAGTDGLPWET